MAFCAACQAWFKKKFDLADVNKTGAISLSELENLAGTPPFENKKKTDMVQIYFMLDKDHSCGISLDEWVKYYSIKFPPKPDSDECPRSARHHLNQ